MLKSRLSRLRSALVGGVIGATTVAMIGALAAPASAIVIDEPARPAFYEAPSTLPADNGAVIRQESITPRFGGVGYKFTRVLYKSTSRSGAPTAISGTVIMPSKPWTGPGARPLIGYAPGTQGVADRCAPSRLYTEGFEYEAAVMDPLLKAGYAVAITDYEGLGTQGLHTYMVRESQAHAVLDVVRAAKNLLPAELGKSPVGLQGFSQGGGGAAAATELAPSYAPELPVKGAMLGAVPADLSKVAPFIDGTLWSVFNAYASLGIAQTYNVDMSPYLNDKGKAFYQKTQGACVFNLLDGAFVKSKTLTADGQPMSVLMSKEPFRSMVDAQRIGRLTPNVPVMMVHSKLDDTVPFGQGRQLGLDWCANGVNVKFSSTLMPTHGGSMLAFIPLAVPFWKGRFAGQSFVGNCGRF